MNMNDIRGQNEQKSPTEWEERWVEEVGKLDSWRHWELNEWMDSPLLPFNC